MKPHRIFFVVAGAGILIGLVIAIIVYAIHRFSPTTPAIDAAFTLITPYVMYVTAEHFHCSGVLSVVTGGLFLGYRSQEIMGYESRLNVAGLWDTLLFLLNGFVFILIGLELPVIVQELGDYSLSQAIFYGVIISLVTIIARMPLQATSNTSRHPGFDSFLHIFGKSRLGKKAPGKTHSMRTIIVTRLMITR